MSKKERVLLFVVLAVLFIAVFMSGMSSVEGRAKPDIIMTPSYTDYLTVECYGGASGIVLDYNEGSTNSGKLRCLPIRPE